MGTMEDIREVFDQYGAEGPNDGTYLLPCPFCEARVRKSDGKHKLTVRTSGMAKVRPRRGALPEPFECSPDRAVWNCFRCKARGIDDFTWLVEAAPATEATRARELREANEPLPPDGFEALDVEKPEHWGAFHYLRGRSEAILRAALAAGAGIVRGLGSERKYRGRVIIPCRDPVTRAWLGFVGRDIKPDSNVPYLTPKRMPRERIVAGLEDEALRQKGAPLYVVEGMFDRLALFPYAAATLGTGFQDAQVDLLAEFSKATGRPLVPCFDGDAPAENRSLQVQLLMRGATVPGRCELPPGLDPGKIGWRVLDHYVGQ